MSVEREREFWSICVLRLKIVLSRSVRRCVAKTNGATALRRKKINEEEGYGVVLMATS